MVMYISLGSLCTPNCLSVCLSVYVYVRPSVHPAACLSVCLPVYMCICLSVCFLSVSLCQMHSNDYVAEVRLGASSNMLILINHTSDGSVYQDQSGILHCGEFRVFWISWRLVVRMIPSVRLSSMMNANVVQ